MILNDLQRLRWQILDEALRDPEIEYFMGERTKTNETGNTRSLIHFVNTRLKQVDRNLSCSKRMLQNDVNFFKKKGARLMPSFRRGHKRILRYINLEWKNPLLRPASFLNTDEAATVAPLPEGPMTAVTLRITGNEEALLNQLQQPTVDQRASDVKTGKVTLTVEVPVSPLLKGILLSMGTDLEVLAPESLRDDIRQTINALQKMYKKDTSAAKKDEPIQGDLFGGLF